MSKPIFGLSAALVTPYTSAGAVDLSLLAEHARSVLARGCDGVTLCGTTGEGYGLTLDERKAMQAALVEALPNGARIHVGIMASAIGDAIAQSSAALDAGAAGLLMAPPFYLKGMGDDGLFEWFSRVFEGIGEKLRGVIMYHIPGQTAVPLSPDLIGRLRKAWPGVITGIKDSSGDWATAERYLATHGDISVLVGDERLLPRAMAKGADTRNNSWPGCVPRWANTRSRSNVWPPTKIRSSVSPVPGAERPRWRPYAPCWPACSPVNPKALFRGEGGRWRRRSSGCPATTCPTRSASSRTSTCPTRPGSAPQSGASSTRPDRHVVPVQTARHRRGPRGGRDR